MLYYESRLDRICFYAYQIIGDVFYRHITTEILDYVAREMGDANGGFYSSQDADSEGHEGKFFVWTPDEIRSVLGGSTSGLLIVSKAKQDTNDAQLFMDAYGVTANGNFEGNISCIVLATMMCLRRCTIQRRKRSKAASRVRDKNYLERASGA